MNPDSENKTLEIESSDDEIITEKISWAKAADSYSILLKFSKSQPCIAAQEIIQLPLSHCFSAGMKRMHQASRHLLDISEILKSHTDLHSYPEEQH
jgi:hypothetical protein